jgi:hypothetical protein
VRLGALLAVGLATVLLAAGSNAALVEVGSIVVRGNAKLLPKERPRHQRVPVEISGFFDVSSKAGVPPRLQRIVLEPDEDLRLAGGGIPTCSPARIERATTGAARRRCGAAIVGTGQVEAMVQVEGRWLRVRAPLTFFNGPAGGGAATVLAHASPRSLPGEIYVVSIPVSRGKGGYAATVDVPEIFNPTGILVRAEVEIGRPGSRGPLRRFATARCSDVVVETHGTFIFADGTTVAGPAATDCTPTR